MKLEIDENKVNSLNKEELIEHLAIVENSLKILDELAREYIDGVKQYHTTPNWDLMQTAVCYGYHPREEVESECVESVKPAEWSEEDNSIIDALACYIENWRLFAADKNYKRTMWTSDPDEVEKYLIVLNKIKHLHPQQRKEWSEENDTAIHLACEFIRHHSRKGDSIGGIDCVELVKMLKSLRYQSISKPSWKPSEEQIKELLNALIPGKDFDCDILAELYKQLKKL